MVERTVGVTPPRVLTIAGTDSGGGAGVAADLRTWAACGVHGCVAVTAVTVQNSVGVTDVHLIPPQTVAAQIQAVADDIGLDAAKSGTLATAATIDAVCDACDRVGIGSEGGVPFVVDPVAAASTGAQLLADDALDAMRTQLFPRASLVTPNLDEVRTRPRRPARTRRTCGADATRIRRTCGADRWRGLMWRGSASRHAVRVERIPGPTTLKHDGMSR